VNHWVESLDKATFSAFALILTGFVTTEVRASPDVSAALISLQQADARVAAVGWKLATSNASLCPTGQGQSGIRLHARRLYAQASWAAVEKLFGLDDRPAALAVVPGSAAFKAGLRAGDKIAAINGRVVSAIDAGREGADHIARLEADLSNARTGTSLDIEKAGERAGVKQSLHFASDPGCTSRFELLPSGKLNARADGEAVRITTAVVNETRDDSELAFVLAHEMAHNIMGHPARLKAQGRSAGRVRATEIEADQMAIKLMRGAGYDSLAAARFWARFGKKTGFGIFSDGTHLRTKARVQLLEEAAAQPAQ
jgi:beta-barrel assembly-enhancing protease